MNYTRLERCKAYAIHIQLVITSAGWNKFAPLIVLMINTDQIPKGGGHVQENDFCPGDSFINFRSL
jgi:hypothetical protein